MRSESGNVRERLLLDRGWRFHLGHGADPTRDFGFGTFDKGGGLVGKAGAGEGAVSVTFDDSAWRAVDLPHDWAVELECVREPDWEKGHRATGRKPVARLHPDTTIGWYRRAFTIPQGDLGRRVMVEFDGVFRDAHVWINGHLLGRSASGYTGFRYDVSDFLEYGGENVLVVRADAGHHEGWFYEGAGIYRHVWLTKTGPLHVAPWGAAVTTALEDGRALVSARVQVVNECDEETGFVLCSTLLDPEGRAVAERRAPQQLLAGWGEAELCEELAVAHPALWSLRSPQLYRLVTTLERGGAVLDRYETPFGIRTCRWDPDQGFFLNGEHVILQGACCHQDHAGTGAALPDRVHYFRIEKLKEMGGNAYRSAHNPPTPELLDACDRLGMLVMVEQRQMGSSPEVLAQVREMVTRHRNHPSVILWCIGNEEMKIQGTDLGARIAATMKRTVRAADPSRPVTLAMNGEWGKGCSRVVDLFGFNYRRCGDIDAFHRDFPALPVVGTEEASHLGTRGVYQENRELGHFTAYDDNGHASWGSTAEQWWTYYRARPFISGGFIWTGFDYHGEPNPEKWPVANSSFGPIDLCGFPKDNFYYYQSWWTDRTVLHLLPHWTWPGREGQPIDVRCLSNCEEVELFLNGASLGRQTMAVDSHLRWSVPYAPGTLLAHGFRRGRLVAEEKVETTGAPARVLLAPDRAKLRADGEDVAMITVSIADAAGRVVPAAGDDVRFTVAGPGKILGVGNGDPSGRVAEKASHCPAFHGLCLLIVQSGTEAGAITVTAEAPGLEPVTLRLDAEPCALRPAVP